MDTKPNFHIVVGDGYSVFASNAHVMTISEVPRRLAQDENAASGVFVVGQGISQTDRLALTNLLDRYGATLAEDQAVRAPLSLTHKRRIEHVLISPPHSPTPRTYVFQLALGDEEDRLCDHVTGRHISAMVIMEAGRQATIAALEREFPFGAGEEPWGLILESFTTKFSSYLFPVSTELRLTVLVRDQKESCINVTLNIDVQQSGTSACGMELNVRMMREGVLQKLESRRADSAVSYLKSEYLNAMPMSLSAA